MARRSAAPLAVLGLAMFVPFLWAQGQGAVAAAKDAYANAEYDRCVTLLESATLSDEEIVAAAEYRTLCLVALDREPEAERVVADILRAQPLYTVPASASPRLRTLVARVKRKVLPAIVQERYTAAKKAYDSHDNEGAVAGFRTVIALLDDPDLDADTLASLSGLKTVATGFIDLITAIPPPAPPPVAPVTPVPRIYTGSDAGITSPEIVDQGLPAWRPDPSFVRAGITLRGTVEVIIDEKGTVESARLIAKIHPEYDTRLIRAAKSWTYRPARQQDGTAVKFRKLIDITLKPS